MTKKGVTLIELIIVIVIIGLVSAFAVPNVVRYLTQSQKSNVYNDALIIEQAAKDYCIENTCETGTILTSAEIGQYIEGLKSDYSYDATLLENGYFAVRYYKEGEYSYPYTGDGDLINNMVPSLTDISFVSKLGGGVSDTPDEDDFIPPVGEPYVQLVGDRTVYVEYGGTYTEPGYNAYASDGSPITNKWNSGMGGTWSFGTTTITYSCYSSYDNKSCVETTRYVTIVDTTPPSVTINGNQTITINRGDSFTDYWGAWAYDKSGTQSPVTSSGSVDTSTVGTYTITYSSTDSSGNTGTAVRTIIVK
jgi:prepilin-type N-terminal cleavage/methylation domain-containing protein